MCPPEFTLLERWGCVLIEKGMKSEAEIPNDADQKLLLPLFENFVATMPEERSPDFDDYVQKMNKLLEELDGEELRIHALAAYLKEHPSEHEGHVMYALLALEYGREATEKMVPRMKEVEPCTGVGFHIL